MEKKLIVVIVFVAGIVLGNFLPKFYSEKPVVTPEITTASVNVPVEQVELVGFQKLTEMKIREAKRLKIYDRTAKIVSLLGQSNGVYCSYEINGATLISGGISPFDTSVEIEHNGTTVFKGTPGLFSESIQIFHPGSWVDLILGFDIERETKLKQISELKQKFSF